MMIVIEEKYWNKHGTYKNKKLIYYISNLLSIKLIKNVKSKETKKDDKNI